MRTALLNRQNIWIALLLLMTLPSQAQFSSSCMEGDCQNNYGIKVWSNGERYEGWFKKGMRDGYGYMKYENGNTYIGEWSENLRDGHGVLTYNEDPTKRKYVGEWKNNTIQGYGTLHFKRSKMQTGEWKKNVFKPLEGTDICIEGDCENGWGKYIFKDHSFYIGEFKDGKRHGQGTQIYQMGSKYKGTHVDGKRDGYGIYYYAGGNQYRGTWKNDKKFGNGKMYMLGRLDYAGVWENNILIKRIDASEADANITAEKIDEEPPTIDIKSPSVSRGPIIVSKSEKIRVHGTATDESGVQLIRVNGVEAALSNQVGKKRDFEAYINLSKGQNEFWVEATDTKGNKVKIDFTVLYEGKKEETVASDKIPEPKKDAPRMALVIGNSTYVEAPLRNPMNDATAIASRLNEFGFDVTIRLNVKQKDMKEIIREFGQELKKKGGIGVFYYAGHGVQMNGENYLIPVDAKIEKPLDVEVESIDLQRILNELDYANNQMNLVILDACRDNPYARLRSAGKGLAPVLGAPVGTFIAYATSPGQAASDGDGSHGLYTQELLNALDQSKGMSIEDIFKIVRSQVSQKSDKTQIPWENSSLIGDFIINP